MNIEKTTLRSAVKFTQEFSGGGRNTTLIRVSHVKAVQFYGC